jgi:predicted nucleic acid-binding protein
LNVVDSSGWIEYFSDGRNSTFFAEPIESPDTLVVPTLTLFEVFKHVLRNSDQDRALRVVAGMRRGRVVDLTSSLALAAAQLSSTAGLALADSVILATAQAHGATLWTQDRDFRDMDGVRFRPKA